MATSERITRYLEARAEQREAAERYFEASRRFNEVWYGLTEEEQDEVRRLLSSQASAEGSR